MIRWSRPPILTRWLRRLRSLRTRSLRYTLTLWYVGIVGAILCLFSVVLYVTVASSLSRDVDQTLALQAESLSDSVFSFWRAERAAAGAGPGNWVGSPSHTFGAEVDQGRLPEVLTRWAQTTGALETERPIRLVAPSGRTLHLSSSFIPFVSLIPDTEVREARQHQKAYRMLRLSGRRVRLITYTVTRFGRPAYFVQMAAGLQPMDKSLARLALWLLILIPSMLFLVGLAVSFLSTRALWPIRRMILQTQWFMTKHLHERVVAPFSRDEVERLATILDDMVARLESAFRHLRQFSAAAAHELRTTLTVIRGELSLALRKPHDAEEYRHLLQTHLDLTNDMTKTVEQLLSLARWEAAEEVIDRAPIELNGLVEEAVRTFRTVAEGQKIGMGVVADGSLWVHGDRRLLGRVMTNLLDNAIKHTPAQGRVTSTIERRENEAWVSVHDTGPGIPSEDLPHLFDRFFKSPTAVDRGESTGLGLGLCRWIVEAHHGTMEVTSTPPQGATFTIKLPLSQRQSS